MNEKDVNLNEVHHKSKEEIINALSGAIDELYASLKSMYGTHDVKLEAVVRIAFNIENEIGFGLSNDALDQISRLVDSYGVSEVVAASEISIHQYFDGTEESAKKCMDKLGGILYNRSRGLKFFPFKRAWF